MLFGLEFLEGAVQLVDALLEDELLLVGLDLIVDFFLQFTFLCEGRVKICLKLGHLV